MRVTVALLVLAGALLGGLYYWQTHQDRCSTSGFGIIGQVQVCQRPDGSVYLPNAPTPGPPGVERSVPPANG